MSRREIKFYLDSELKKCSVCSVNTNCYKAFDVENKGKREEFVTCGPTCLSKHLPKSAFDKWPLVMKWLFCFWLTCLTMFILLKVF